MLLALYRSNTDNTDDLLCPKYSINTDLDTIIQSWLGNSPNASIGYDFLNEIDRPDDGAVTVSVRNCLGLLHIDSKVALSFSTRQTRMSAVNTLVRSTIEDINKEVFVKFYTKTGYPMMLHEPIDDYIRVYSGNQIISICDVMECDAVKDTKATWIQRTIKDDNLMIKSDLIALWCIRKCFFKK